MKRLIIFLTLSFILTAGISFAKEKPIEVFIGSDKVSFDQAPVVKNNRTLVPLRGVFESLGAVVSWDNETKTVYVTKDGLKVSLKTGSKVASLNSQKITLDQSADIINKRVLVPLRFLSEALNTEVTWDAKTRSVYIVKQAPVKDFEVIDIQ